MAFEEGTIGNVNGCFASAFHTTARSSRRTDTTTRVTPRPRGRRPIVSMGTLPSCRSLTNHGLPEPPSRYLLRWWPARAASLRRSRLDRRDRRSTTCAANSDACPRRHGPARVLRFVPAVQHARLVIGTLANWSRRQTPAPERDRPATWRCRRVQEPAPSSRSARPPNLGQQPERRVSPRVPTAGHRPDITTTEPIGSLLAQPREPEQRSGCLSHVCLSTFATGPKPSIPAADP